MFNSKMITISLIIFFLYFSFNTSFGYDPPSLNFPANTDQCVSPDVLFEWSSDEATVSYDIVIALDPGMINIIDAEYGFPETSFTSYNLEYYTQYYWYVRAYYPDESELLSEVFNFTTNHQPPNLNLPLDMENCIDRTINLTWYPLVEALSYSVELAYDSEFTDIMYEISNIRQTNFTFSELPFGTTLYWRVKAHFIDCQTEWSVYREFRTVENPPTLIQPINNQQCIQVTTNFTWQSVPTAISYNLQISTSNTFGSFVVDEQNIEETGIQIELPEYNQRYYWRVSANLPDCQTYWAGPFNFLTIPEPIHTLYPQDRQVGIPINLTLSWSEASYETSYSLQVYTTPTFDEYIVNETQLTATTYSLTNLEHNKDYIWKVKSNDPNCQTLWSEAARFTTSYRNMNLLYPKDGEECVTLNATFEWGQVIEAFGYRIQVARDEEFADIVFDELLGDVTEYEGTLLDNSTVHYWRVRAEDQWNTGDWSFVFQFKTTPSPPALIFPENESSNIDVNLNFQWEQVNENAFYDFLLSKNSDFSDTLVYEIDLNTEGYEYSLPEFFMDYYWKVRTNVDNCRSEWSDVFTFKTSIPAPILLLPENHSDKQANKQLLFQWEDVPNAETYVFQLSKDIDFETSVEYAIGIQSSTYLMPLLGELTEYYWRVFAVNEHGRSNWSEVFTFTTGASLPNRPIPISPISGSVKIPKDMSIVWSLVDDATSYDIQIDTVETNPFTNPIMEISNITDTTLELNDLVNFTVYYWRVRAVNDYGYSNWTNPWNFRVIALPPDAQTVLMTPVDDIENTENYLTFTWRTVIRATEYNLQISKDELFTESEIVQDIYKIYKLQRLVSNFEYDTKYYWRVRGLNEAGEGPWSEIRNFKTKEFVSVDENFLSDENITILPNPVNDNANLILNLTSESIVSIQIFDLLGNAVIESINSSFSKGTYSIPLNINNINNGVYFCSVKIGSHYFVKQLIISK